MYLSLNWLKDFVEIPESLTPEQLGLKLTMHTVEIEGIKKQAKNLDRVVVGEILEIKKHPDADKLSVAQVDVGEIKPRQIVFGQALKLEVGYKLPVALAPTILPTGQEIKKAKLRGELSEGMFCLDQELGLAKDGISGHFFGKEIKNGINIIEALKLDDVIFEVDNKSITNRPDLWSHYGMAREISAFLNTKMIDNKKFSNPNFQFSNKFKINVHIEDYKLCPRYMAIAMDGIKIEDSPEWMQKRLIAVGMRPINNIVDITNYVMLELGQPTHIFDLNKIFNFSAIGGFASGEQFSKSQTNIIIRNAKNGETIETLDGQDRKLDENMLVIANEEKPIAIAGVMGGANSEVDDNTTSILIESANFNPVSIRKTAQKLDLRSEASMRFEKSLDPNLCEMALCRIVELIKEFCPNVHPVREFCSSPEIETTPCDVKSLIRLKSTFSNGAKIISELQDEKKFELNQGPIELDLEWVNQRIGKKIAEKKVIEILENLGFKIENKKNNNILSIIIPTWRATKDISIPEDLVEEIIRIYGYDNLQPEMPKIAMQAPEINAEQLLERKIKNILSIGAKLTEVYNYSFISEDQLVKLNIYPVREQNSMIELKSATLSNGVNSSSIIKLANSLSEDLTILRPNLISGLLKNIKINQAKYENINLFEFGSVFLNSQGDINKDNESKETLPQQEKYIGIITASKEDNLFYGIKGIVEYLMNNLGLKIDFEPIEIYPGWADKKIIAQIKVLNKDIGIVAQLDNQVATNLGIKKQVAIAEINFQKLYDLILLASEKKYKELEKYPAVIRDLAFVVSQEILYNDIKNEIENFNDLIKQVELFDVYQGEKLGENKKSLAFHVVYQANKTLTSEEIDQMQEKLIKNLEKKFKAQIRDF